MELRIKEVCKLKGITLQQLADMLGITRQALSISIKNNPSTERISKIASALNVTVFELIASDSSTYHSYTENNEWKGVIKK